tara:strand:+ start:459 stop:941 length:483 start_codon:yes stop_codon:yes gene_type:complete
MSGLINSEGQSIAGSRSGIISDGLDIYAQLNNCSTTYGDMTFGTLTGDSTNITQDGVNVTLVKAGVYYITCTFNWTLNESERYCFGKITSVSGTYSTATLAVCNDEIVKTEAATSYGGATATYVGLFAASDVIKFNYTSGATGDVTNRADSHASIFRIFN